MKLLTISTGRPHVLAKRGRQYSTAINKRPVDGPQLVGIEGIDGDRVADLSVHGGPEKAVCIYPREHYDWLAQRLAAARSATPTALMSPAFGENFTTDGLLEAETRLGDTFRIGSATFQVTQPRQPCYKLANKHDQPQIIEWIYETGFCGFYFRVLTPGTVTAGDAIEPLSRGDAELTVARVLGALFSRGSGAALLERLAAYEPAASNLRAWAKRVLLGDEEGDDA